MRLRRSAVRGPGIRRVGRGKGFSYEDPSGTPVTDAETLQRIKDLVIPPAWKNVWICPYPNGHIQAVGTDAAENNSYGIATLLCEHVSLQKQAVEFDYPAKSGVRRTLLVDDQEVVRSVRALLRREGQTERLLVCRNGSGW